MYHVIGEASLKDGSRMEIGVILGPDADHADEICPFLGHKGPGWQEHIEGAAAGRLDDLETRFYVGKVNGVIVTNIMTVEHLGVGILGHVYTTPPSRRLGACNAVMERQMDEFRTRGGRCLHLATGFDSAPYHIYKRHGFGSILPESGVMRYMADDNVLGTYFAERPATAREIRWDDWGPLTTLTASHDCDWLRSVAWRMEGPENFEDGFLGFRQSVEDGDIAARALVTEDGDRVGVATLTLHPMWTGTRILDVLCHPNFWSGAADLCAGFDSKGKVVAYADAASTGKLAALEGLGFRREATLSGRVTRRIKPDWRPPEPDAAMFDASARDDTPLDVVVLSC